MEGEKKQKGGRIPDSWKRSLVLSQGMDAHPLISSPFAKAIPVRETCIPLLAESVCKIGHFCRCDMKQMHAVSKERICKYSRQSLARAVY